jgi:hypothetical protein
MESEGSLSFLKETATGPYPEPGASSPHASQLYFPKINSNIILRPPPMSSE